jgi:hypothetical protein
MTSRAKYLFIAILILLSNLSFSQIANWSEHIAPIIFDKCSPCHHSQGAGHADLTKYDSAVYHGAAIQYYVSQHKMPPWPPNTNYHRYANERVLTADEIDKIANWVNNSNPLGDTALLPPVPIYTSAALLTITPDHVFQMPTFTIPNLGNNDVYWNFVIPANNAQEITIKGFEFIPGNSEIVHHALIYVDTGQAIINKDNATPGPGFQGFGGPGTSTAKLIGAYIPGSQPFLFPDAFGMKIPPNAQLIFGMHYPAASVGSIDSSKIHFFNSPTANIREVFLEPVLNHSTNLINGPLFIPANTTKTFRETYTLPLDFSVFGVAPHMHLIGRRIKVFGLDANNDSIPLIDIPEWDFRWQGMYYFPRIKKLNLGTTLWSEAFYDNTISNPFNPSNPPVAVGLGEATTDEMMLTYFAFTVYQTGDENIILDSLAVALNSREFGYESNEFFPIYPNPARNEIILKWYSRKPEAGIIDIYNIAGQKIYSIDKAKSSSYQTEKIDISSFPSGNYIINLTIAGNTYNQKMSKQ